MKGLAGLTNATDSSHTRLGTKSQVKAMADSQGGVLDTNSWRIEPPPQPCLRTKTDAGRRNRGKSTPTLASAPYSFAVDEYMTTSRNSSYAILASYQDHRHLKQA